MTSILRDALLATVLATVVALGTNAVRSRGLPLVQKEAYQLLVPCPEVTGPVPEMAASDPRLTARGTLVIDARTAEEYAAWHLPGARNVPFDFLSPTRPEVVSELAASGAPLVAVYGDGLDPDSGRELAAELMKKGIRNVLHVTGGAPALGGPASEELP